MDTFLWGFNPRDFPDQPERPFITYPFQKDAVRRVNAAVGRHNLVVPKSRGVGGTYIILGTFFHRWLFRRLQSFLLSSAKKERVDQHSDPDSLMWKIDHWLSCLPSWMRPAVDRVDMRIANLEMDSVFNGETTNENIGRGGRRTATLEDEAASMPNVASIIASLSAVSNCNIYLSTFKGAFGGFYSLYEKYMRERPEWVLKMHWTEHPVYSQGLYYDSSGKPRSPWYDLKRLELISDRQASEELDIDPQGAGGVFFEPSLLARLLGEHGTAKPPSITCELPFDEEGHYSTYQSGPQGRLQLWTNLSGDLPQKAEYVAGVDIASGKGGDMSSQSALSVVNKNTGRKVAQFCTSHMTPTTFARQVVAICRWFHDAKLIWGSQGPGGDFEVTVKRCKYYSIFRRPGGENKPGFVESPEGKLSLFGNYQDALHRSRFINPSKEALEECRQFIFARDTVVHSKAIQKDADPEHAGKLHGDIVVADAMAAHLLPHLEPKATASAAEPEIGTFAWRQREVQRISDRNRQEDWLTVADPLASVE